MNRIICIAICVVASLAMAQQGSSVRVGGPLTPPPANDISSAVDMDQPPEAVSSSDTAVLDVHLPKLYYDAGDAVVLDTHLHTRGGADLDGATLTVEDTVRGGVMDTNRPEPKHYKGNAKGHGHYQAALSNEPGQHYLIVSTDAIYRGNSTHRAVASSYVVATGSINVLGIGDPEPRGALLVVPLKVVAPHGGAFEVSATIASGNTAVARADTHAVLENGAGVVELPFAQQDIVEPGPYRIVGVTIQEDGTLAYGPHDVSGSFEAAHANGEPPKRYTDDGALAGGPYGPTPDFSQPPPTPVIPEPQEARPYGPGMPPIGDAPDVPVTTE
jgi:hypothetical protein